MFRERVSTLLHQGDTYAKRLDAERRRSVDLDAAVRALRVEHLQARKALCTTTTAAQCTGTTALKSIVTLESRLDNVLTRYNEVCNANKALREHIQVLRRDKMQQVAVSEKLARETVQVETENAQVLDASQAASDARDRAQREMEALRHQVKKDGHVFEAKWVEKTSQLAHDRLLMRELRASKNGVPAAIVPSPSTLFLDRKGGDEELRNETAHHEKLLHEKATDLQKQSDQLRTCQEHLACIKGKTGEVDATKLATALVVAEEKSFAFCKMINELQTEIEALEVANHKLEVDVKDQTRAGGMEASAEDTRTCAVQHQVVEAQIAKAREKVRQLDTRQKEASAGLDVLKVGAVNLFHKLQGGNDEAFASQLATHGATDVTLTTLVGWIEQRVGELVDIHNIATNASLVTLGASDPAMKAEGQVAWSKGPRHLRSRRGGACVHATGTLVRPPLPTADDFDSDTEEPQDEVRPCRIDDLLEKTAAGLTQRKEKLGRQKR